MLLLEKDYAGRHSSGVNAGGVRQLARDVAEIPLSVYSMEFWHRIGELVDDDCGFTCDGQVLVAETQDEFESFRSRVQELNGLGYRHEELIDAAELRRLVPAVAETCPGGIVSRRDGAADPFRTTQAFRRKAEKLGARVLEGVIVTDVTREGSTWIVRTSAGPFEAPMIVNAAGAWADRIAAMLGEPVPLEVIAPMLMITARVPAFIRPVVILRGRKLSFKQFANGTVLIGGGHLGRPVRDQNVTVLDWTKLAESAKTVWERLPGHARDHDSAGLGRHRGENAGRYPGVRKAAPQRTGRSTSSASRRTGSSLAPEPAPSWPSSSQRGRRTCLSRHSGSSAFVWRERRMLGERRNPRVRFSKVRLKLGACAGSTAT